LTISSFCFFSFDDAWMRGQPLGAAISFLCGLSDSFVCDEFPMMAIDSHVVLNYGSGYFLAGK
jgi:hypothetical protein